jgi:2-oxoglutarate ferredoxin oxidoreductase subunit gamma
MARYEIRLAGSGGQGIILAAIILAEAAGVPDGKYVCQTQSYGPEARGGASKAEVVISDQEIDYPQITKPDVLLCMNQSSCEAYAFDLKPDGLLLVDASFVHDTPTTRAVSLPFTKIARDEVGRVQTANIVALGALAVLSGAVGVTGLKAAVLARIPRGTEELNEKALEAGFLAARQYLEAQAGKAPGS